MFILDKEALKRKMEEFIAKAQLDPPPYVGTGFYCPEELEKAKEHMMYEFERQHELAHQHVERYVKPLISSVVNELINQMYGHDEFEKDLGLK